MSKTILRIRWLRELDKRQVGRYLVVGAWNTLFSFLSYAALTALLTPLISYAYIFASVISSVLSITVSFLGYKWFVFKTKGNYLREWFRCVIVYSGSIIFGTLVLPVLVFALRHLTRSNASAPYLAGAILAGMSVVASFFGHKKFSFAPTKKERSVRPQDAL